MTIKIYLDLETIPDQADDARDRAMEHVKAPANYKNEEAIEKYKIDHAATAWEKTALQGIAGEICSIAYAIGEGAIESLTRGVDVDIDDEAGLITAFFEVLESVQLPGQGTHSSIEWVGHNVIEFDLRFLHQRAIILGIHPTIRIPADARHGNGKVFDTMREWAGFRGFVKQAELQEAFHIPTDDSLDLVGGDQVATFWREAKFGEIARYNRDDIRVCREIFKRLTWAE